MKIGNSHFNFTHHGYIMGILNMTPDSFSDGGKFSTVDAALHRAKQMIYDGASIIDIGGESTRPGHANLTAKEEIARVLPIIEALSSEMAVPISIDTSKSAVAKAALQAGASMVNDIWGFKHDSQMAKVIYDFNVPCCLMHNRDNKNYNHLIEEMLEDLTDSIHIATEAGISPENLILDPGIGFAKTLEDNLLVMEHLDRFNRIGFPLLLGTSRKSMIGLTLDLPVDDRLEGTLATTVYGYMKGCRIFRVHDVVENYRALKMVEAMTGSSKTANLNWRK